MSSENTLNDGGIANAVDAQNHEGRSSYSEGAADAEDLPRYSESETLTSQQDTAARQLPTHTSSEGSRYQNDDSASSDPIAHEPAQNEYRDIITEYFTAIREGNHGAITGHLETSAVTAETATPSGLTPLLAAIEAGHISTARLLLDAGADANAYGVVGITGGRGGKTGKIHRTPLQLAAARGNLPIVKLLMETYHADDALVAPDGELALRLAAANGHREIVAYLPARRGGGFKRWKARHEVAMRRARRAAHGIYEAGVFVGYRVPKFLLWSVPKHAVVLPVARWAKWLYTHRAELPRLVAAGLRRLWAGLKALPGDVVELAKLLRDVVVATVKGVPKALGILAKWVGKGLLILLGVVWLSFDRLFSLLHTVGVAVGTFFRKVTLKNVWDGFVAFVHAVVVEGPKRLWLWMRKFGSKAIEMLEAVWGWFGELLGWIFWSLVKALTYVPRKLWEILASMLRSLGYGGKEVMIWINPKR
ncbi:hypothetical protein F4803DRAFT_444999 [Xylaria telfairii]|nr:hypothetical protein F4803DRAFT_444999 [Xylaria telfairii]